MSSFLDLWNSALTMAGDQRNISAEDSTSNRFRCTVFEVFWEHFSVNISGKAFEKVDFLGSFIRNQFAPAEFHQGLFRYDLQGSQDTDGRRQIESSPFFLTSAGARFTG
jgi:hypothetical protein